MRRSMILTLLLFSLSVPATGQGKLAPRTGTLLVATTQLADTRFQQSVILITRHDRAGTSGLVLNRPLGKLPSDLGGSLQTRPQGIFWGGPVAPLQVRALLLDNQQAAGKVLAEGLHLLNADELNAILHKTPLESGELRTYLGYAGWAPRQLAFEIARGDWLVLPVNAATLQQLNPEQMWRTLAPRSEANWI